MGGMFQEECMGLLMGTSFAYQPSQVHAFIGLENHTHPQPGDEYGMFYMVQKVFEPRCLGLHPEYNAFTSVW
jgi:hypothetical protein